MSIYHGSDITGLKTIEARESKGIGKYVFASKNKIIPILFFGKYDGDYLVGVNVQSNVIQLIERVKSATELCYKNKGGSVYELPDDNFRSDLTRWNGELVCPHDVEVLSEEYIDDVFVKIKELENNKQIEIYYYPNRPDFIPVDDSDLISLTIYRMENFGNSWLEKLRLYHPHLAIKIEKEKQKKT